jgi:hypothetical protein
MKSCQIALDRCSPPADVIVGWALGRNQITASQLTVRSGPSVATRSGSTALWLRANTHALELFRAQDEMLFA